MGILFLSCLIAVSAYPQDRLFLSLEDVSELALKNNLDIQMAKFDAYITRHNLGVAISLFDTYLSASASYDNNELDTASTLMGSESRTRNYSLGISKKIPLGTSFEVEAYNRRLKSDSSFYSVNPSTEANVAVSLTQPLVRNFFGIADRGEIKMTRIDIANSDISSLDRIETSLAAVQQAYWELVLRHEELKIKKDMLKDAERLYDIYKRKIKVGLVEKPDLLAAEANVSLRRSDIMEARMKVEEAENNLLYLLNISHTDKEIVPQDNLKGNTYSVSLVDALREAIKARRDYQIVKNEIKSSDIEVSLKRNALWPQIDIVASFVRNGIDLNYKDAWRRVSTQNHHDWSVGINFSFPLERSKEKAEYKQAKLKKAQLLVALKRTEKLIFRDVNNTVTEVNTLVNQIETLKKVVALQEAKLKAEERRVKYGRSSSDIIIRYQEDLLSARLALARAYFSYHLARIKLEKEKNTLLARYWKGEI